MLAIIRDKATGWIAGIIVGALIISFAFWGVNFYFGQSGDVNVATVNGSEIKLQTFQRSFYNLRQQMQSIFGGNISLGEDALIKEQTIQNLIDTEVVNQIIEDSNLRITDKKVVDTIKNLELFKNEDGFDRTKYEHGISSLGVAPVFFERQLRMDLLIEQLKAGLSESLFVLGSELEDIFRLKLQTRDITYSIFKRDSFIDESDVDEASIEAFYKAHPENYTDPEKIRIAYLELNTHELSKSIATDEESLRTYYVDNKHKYDAVEQRSVTKLVIKTGEEKGLIQESDEVKAKANGIMEKSLAMIKEGMTFKEVVEKFTGEGKDVLQFSEHALMVKGIMEKEVDEFLFSANEGDISDIIETKQGLNIVKVGEIRDDFENVYESVAGQVEKDYRKRQAELQFFELSDKLTTLSYEHSNSLEIAAETIAQDIIETDYFSRESKAEGITANSKIISTSFNPELISSGENSEVIELSENHIVVLRILDHKVVAIRPLIDIREQVITDIRMEKTFGKIREHSAMIVEQLRSGVATEDISSDVGIEWSTVEKIKRDDISVNRTVLRTAFQSGKPVNGEFLVSSNRLGSGDYAIVVVTAIYDGEVDAEDETVMKSIDLELRRIRRNIEWQKFLKNARDNADVTIFKGNI